MGAQALERTTDRGLGEVEQRRRPADTLGLEQRRQDGQ